MIYASISRSLACLETVVHLSGGYALPLNRFLIEIEIPSAIWKTRNRFAPRDCPGWDAEPAGKVSLDWGTSWIHAKTTLIAEVPSIVVPEESNILINPLHRDSRTLRQIMVNRDLCETFS